MVTIAGRLEDPLGNAIPDCQIELITQKNGSVVLVKTSASTSPDGAGNYSMNVKPGIYAVRLIVDGCPPNYIGDIKIYSDSKAGTLNDFLLSPEESEITPALLAQVTDERKQAQTAAQSAQKSATEALSTLTNVVKKTGDTMSGDLTIKKNGATVFLSNASNNGMAIRAEPSGNVSFSSKTDGNLELKMNYDKISNRFMFANLADVTINGKPVLKKSDFGFGAYGDSGLSCSIINNIDTYSLPNGFYPTAVTTAGVFPSGFSEYGVLIVNMRSTSAYKSGSQLYIDSARGRAAFRTCHNNNNYKEWQEIISTSNSTVDSNGFYKKASPICRLFANDNISEVEGFKLAGCGLVNSEADGVVAKRICVGHYEIYGSLGFAKEGWYITLPEDTNGNKKIFAEYSTDQNNVITVKTFTRKFDIQQCAVVAGEPIDITTDRWIDLRLAMPLKDIVEDSV